MWQASTLFLDGRISSPSYRVTGCNQTCFISNGVFFKSLNSTIRYTKQCSIIMIKRVEEPERHGTRKGCIH